MTRSSVEFSLTRSGLCTSQSLFRNKKKKTDNRRMKLLEAVTSVTSNFMEINQVPIDNWAFKLFYKVTTIYLISSMFLATAKQFFGSPIQCDARSVGFACKMYI